MPDPPLCLSEPKYAALVFEHVCFVGSALYRSMHLAYTRVVQACGVGRSPKVDHALSVRFCGACWKLKSVFDMACHPRKWKTLITICA